MIKTEKLRKFALMLFAAAIAAGSAASAPAVMKAADTQAAETPYETSKPEQSAMPQETAAPTDTPIPSETPAPNDGGSTESPKETDEILPAVNITDAVLISKTSIKITWEKMSEADGYRIYHITESGKLEKLKKIKDNAVTTFTDKGLSYGETYRYAVRAYKEYNGETYYGAYDEKGYVKKLKVKSRYKKGYKYYYDADGRRIEDVLAFIGKNPSYLIKVNIAKNVTTVYAKDGKAGYTIPVKAFLCSGNKHDDLGTFSLGTKYRYRTLFFNTYGQWTIRIHGSILFHTVVYKKSRDPNSLDVKEYNKLGTSASHGCIRLKCSDVKWIYDNCRAGTKVIFYKSSNPGPLGKPKLEKLKKWHTWDPTDPNMQYKCKENNCQHELY